MKSAATLNGRLLLVHGTSDDNVHLQNSIQLINAMVDAGRPFDLQLYPGKTHGIAGPETRTCICSPACYGSGNSTWQSRAVR